MAVAPQDPYEVLEELMPRVAMEMSSRYRRVATELIERAQDELDPDCFQRIHGDAHRGNILHNGRTDTESEFFFVDFDDSMTGPVVQDLWMLLSSADEPEERDRLLQGYESLREFPREQLEWIPILRALRILHYAAWINKRWADPAFPRLFPDYGSYNYWAEETEALEKIVWAAR
jgi:Ser/Thr protein kinase RdoA (MazF antagonist)